MAERAYLGKGQWSAERKPTDLCARCGAPRKEHQQDGWFTYAKTGSSSGKGYSVPVFAVTSGTLSSCTAFIEPGETPPKLTEPLPPKSQEFFNLQWAKVHGRKTRDDLQREFNERKRQH